MPRDLYEILFDCSPGNRLGPSLQSGDQNDNACRRFYQHLGRFFSADLYKKQWRSFQYDERTATLAGRHSNCRYRCSAVVSAPP